MQNLFIHDRAKRTLADGYDKELVIEILEFYTRECTNYKLRTNTLHMCITTLITMIMITSYGGEPIYLRHSIGKTTLFGKFLQAAFPPGHRVWGYVRVLPLDLNDQ